MNILFTLCGRAGSQGVKNKNIRNFAGHPISYYGLSAIDLYMKKNKDKFANIKVCLNTDSVELTKAVNAQKCVEVFCIDRDPSLALPHVGKIQVIQDCLQKSENHYSMEFDYICDLDFTSPVRTISDIEKCVDQMIARTDLDLVFSVTESRCNPYFDMVYDAGDQYKKIFDSSVTARQQTTAVYDMNASIYVYGRQFLNNNTSGMLFDGKCGIVEMMNTGILEIDEELDFELFNVIAEYIFSHYDDYKQVQDNIKNLY